MDAAERLDADTETGLIDRALRHDHAAIAALIQRHNQRLYRIARAILRDDDEAEDALQEAYFRAFTHLSSFRREARLGTWLSRIVMNEALGRLRSRVQTLALDAVEETSEFVAQIIPFPNMPDGHNPEGIAARRELMRVIERSIDALPDVFRTVLVARLVEGMSVEETAALFGIEPATVKTRLHRARTRMREDIEKQIGPLLADAFTFAGSRCEGVASRVLQRLAALDSESREP
jgi:RNA polymerase sigma-70 factor (ECF subfamily)